MLQVSDARPAKDRQDEKASDLKSVKDAAASIVTQHRSGKLTPEETAKALRDLSRSRKGFLRWMLDL